jgi:hypothetical protein
VLNRPGGFRDPGEPEEYCRGFQVFDKDMTGFIGVGQLKYILTNLGEKMTEEEVEELLKAVDTTSGEVNYTGMCYLSRSSIIRVPGMTVLLTQTPRRSRPDDSCELDGTAPSPEAAERCAKEVTALCVCWRGEHGMGGYTAWILSRDWPAFTAFVADE